MNNEIALMVLGTAQDGGIPQSGCFNKCCQSNKQKRFVSSISIINKKTKDCWLIDITPDFKDQIKLVKDFLAINELPNIKGIFLTHAHIGHYIGLLDLGVEVMNLKNIPIYTMPKMKYFLESNDPFKFLIKSGNIVTNEINDNQLMQLFKQVSISPFLVPHRNEFSETVGYNIKSKSKSVIYIPDIDSWSNWKTDILDIIKNNDLLFLDGTFYNKNELVHRDISKVPHPYISDSIKMFLNLKDSDKEKIFFTHLNHTNPLLKKDSPQRKSLIDNGYRIAEERQIFSI